MAILGRSELAESSGINGGMAGYGDPFSDMAQFALPSTIKQLMVLCRRLYLTDSVIHPAIWKISNYPITDLRFEAATPAIRDDWQGLFNNVLRVKHFDQLLNLDKNVFGNGMASIIFPFDKWLICPKCNYQSMAKFTKYTFNREDQFEYGGKCGGCKKQVTYDVQDRYLPRAWNRLRLLRWPPISIDIIHNPYSQDTQYFHRIPPQIRQMIARGTPIFTSSLPIAFIKAARINRRMRITNDNFFHMANPTISDTELTFGKWGISTILPAVRITYARRILVRAQEAMAQNRILPLRMLWPLAGNQPTSVGGIGLGNWRGRLESEVRIWMKDPNYISLSPVPVGMGTLGADARPMLLFQEIQGMAEEGVTAMNIPRGFVYGDMNYSGASIALRMVENEMIASRVGLTDFNNGFLVDRLMTYLGWGRVRAFFSSLRMADDIQKLNLLMQLAQTGDVSKKTMLGELGLEWEHQRKQRRVEIDNEMDIAEIQQVGAAEGAGRAQLIAARYQMEAQKILSEGGMPPPGAEGDPAAQDPWMMQEPTAAGPVGPGEGEEDPTQAEMFEQHAQELAGMAPDMQTAQLQAMAAQGNPGYATQLRRRVVPQGSGMNDVNMSPLPDQRPPTRTNSSV